MKTAEELEQWVNELYWLLEHGNLRFAVDKANKLQLDAYKAGMTEAAKEIRKLPIQFCRDLCESAILSARDRKTSL